MPCWVAIAPLMESTTGWRLTDFTGRDPKTIQPPHRSITSAKAARPSIVSPRARSRWQLPCVASGSDRSEFGRARTTRIKDLTWMRELSRDGVQPSLKEVTADAGLRALRQGVTAQNSG